MKHVDLNVFLLFSSAILSMTILGCGKGEITKPTPPPAQWIQPGQVPPDDTQASAKANQVDYQKAGRELGVFVDPPYKAQAQADSGGVDSPRSFTVLGDGRELSLADRVRELRRLKKLREQQAQQPAQDEQPKPKPPQKPVVQSQPKPPQAASQKPVEQLPSAQKPVERVKPQARPAVPQTPELKPSQAKPAKGAPPVAKQPTSRPAAALDQQLQQAHQQAKGYAPQLVREYIDAIRTEDIALKNTEAKTVHFGKANQIYLTDAKTLIAAFEAMISLKGRANVTTGYNGEGRPIQTTVNIGGDVLPELEDVELTDANGAACRQVLCALSAIFKTTEAAYDVLFSYFQYTYLFTLMVPREFTVFFNDQQHYLEFRKANPKLAASIDAKWAEQAQNEMEYQKKRAHFTLLSPEQIRMIVIGLWALPENFRHLRGLMSFAAARPGTDIVEVPNPAQPGKTTTKEISAITTKQGGYHHFNKWGQVNVAQVVFNASNFCIALRNRAYAEPEEKRNYLVLERRLALQAVVHEMAHVMDRSQTFVANSLDDTEFKTDSVAPLYGYSSDIKWLSMSKWHYVPLPEGWKEYKDPTHPESPYRQQLVRPAREIAPLREVKFFFSTMKTYTRYGQTEVHPTEHSWPLTFCGNKLEKARYYLPDENSKRFVSNYAKTDPREDFAEHVAYSVVFPSMVQRAAPDKYRYVSEKVLAGRTYADPPGVEQKIDEDPQRLDVSCARSQK